MILHAKNSVPEHLLLFFVCLFVCLFVCFFQAYTMLLHVTSPHNKSLIKNSEFFQKNMNRIMFVSNYKMIIYFCVPCSLYRNYKRTNVYQQQNEPSHLVAIDVEKWASVIYATSYINPRVLHSLHHQNQKHHMMIPKRGKGQQQSRSKVMLMVTLAIDKCLRRFCKPRVLHSVHHQNQNHI